MNKNYLALTEHFIAALEAGTRPWAKSWTNNATPAGRPLRHNGEPYRGVNVLALWEGAMRRGFTSPYWLTFLQAKEYGGAVRKGARCEHIFKVGTVERKKDGAADDEAAETFNFLRCYAVFNVEEIEGLPERFAGAREIASPENRIACAEDFVARTGASISHGGNRAFYSPAFDLIKMPTFAQFNSPESYYATLLHELTHWTSAEGRADRKLGGRFGDPAYAFEELIAELGAAFLCADLQLTDTPRDDHASYLANWAAALKENPRVLMRAAAAAERAVTFLHGCNARVPAIAQAA